jgi:hypothetical protein
MAETGAMSKLKVVELELKFALTNSDFPVSNVQSI